MFAISDWNVNPNQEYFVRMDDIATGFGVELYNSLADAQAETNRIAYGNAAYGTDREIELTNDTTEPDVTVFNTSLDYHLVASGQWGDVSRIFRIKEFTDLDEIADAMFTSAVVIHTRATHEVNLHTHTRMERTMDLAEHDPDMEDGAIFALQSAIRELDVLVEVEELSILITQDPTGTTVISETVLTVEWVDFRA